ncbi:sensor domain-containing protein [Microvirga guangxiensis]|uniref:PAS domain S-box-containing protein/diguanylate cyclase (GGDEF) domain-containing protein n=1 Tax=Microvirga guangxiensis TaxID=549386 RepID=A0A1G5KQL8_9HYPH|nr:EAL domain-containing protein [Microvirga guangxiensis]SCZ02885.1 PAS domain S-box-containing protein/diguanylate cyclase (GGDEF) domain-containing protein [Microvirga guangxiensis]
MSKNATDRRSDPLEQNGRFGAPSHEGDLLRISIDAMPHMVWSALPDGYNDYHNRRWHEFTGIAVGLGKGEEWINLVHPEDREPVLAVWKSALETGQDCDVEHRLLHHSGEYRWVRGRASPFYNSEGRIERWIGTYTDIHDWKKTEQDLIESEERYRALVGAMTEMVWRAAPDGAILRGWGWQEFSGQMPEEYGGHGWLDAVHPEDRDALLQVWSEAVATARSVEAEFRVLHKNGEHRWVLSRAVPLTNPDGSVREWVGTLTDTHDRRQAQDALKTSEERLRLAMQAGRMIAWEHDLRADYVTRSENAFELLGATSGPLSEFLERVPPEDRVARSHFIDRVRATGCDTMEFRYHLPNGKMLWLASRGERAGPDRVVGVTFDITDRKAAEEEVWRAANHDALTGLPNRVLFQRCLEQSLITARQNGGSVSLMMIDLDDFKDVNDTLGHDAGDTLLKETAARLSAMMREQDTVARLGGDEFAVLMVEPSQSGWAALLGESIIKRLRQPFMYAGRTLMSRASIGVASFPDHDAEPAELLKDADIALYRAKAEGRGRVVTYSPEMRLLTEQRLALGRDVREAISRNEFIPYYQPKVCLESGRVVGLEALARWQHPDRGILTPAAFGAVFDDPELAPLIGKRLIGKIASDMRRWLDSGYEFGRVAFNLSSMEFNQPNLAEDVLRILNLVKVPVKHLEIEVTEKVLLDAQSGMVAETLEKFHWHGVQIALDDFGTGYASLTHLKRFPVDHIKIDHSFIADLEQDEDDAAIVAAVISLGHSLGLHVTAEGVETEGQVQRLRQMKCHSAQGYFYAKPMSAADITAQLEAWPASSHAER